ncbi:MAG: zinc-ribbon domain-containing protein [Gemmatimonadaceae bacterium]
MGKAMADAVAGAAAPAPGVPAAGMPGEPKFCIACGKPIPRSSKFCPECGGAQA